MTLLLPCPFCTTDPIGPEKLWVDDIGNTGWWIECPKCEIVMEDVDRSTLIKRWNRKLTQSKEITMNDVTETIKNELNEAGYDYALAIATQAEIDAGAACGQLSIIEQDSK